jgi:hypothetical protein
VVVVDVGGGVVVSYLQTVEEGTVKLVRHLCPCTQHLEFCVHFCPDGTHGVVVVVVLVVVVMRLVLHVNEDPPLAWHVSLLWQHWLLFLTFPLQRLPDGMQTRRGGGLGTLCAADVAKRSAKAAATSTAGDLILLVSSREKTSGCEAVGLLIPPRPRGMQLYVHNRVPNSREGGRSDLAQSVVDVLSVPGLSGSLPALRARTTQRTPPSIRTASRRCAAGTRPCDRTPPRGGSTLTYGAVDEVSTTSTAQPAP